MWQCCVDEVFQFWHVLLDVLSCWLYCSVWINYDACCDQQRRVLMLTVKRHSLPMPRSCKSWITARSSVFLAELNQLVFCSFINKLWTCIYTCQNQCYWILPNHFFVLIYLYILFTWPTCLSIHQSRSGPQRKLLGLLELTFYRPDALAV